MPDTEAPVLTLGNSRKPGVELDPVTKAGLEKTHVLIAFANSEADSAEVRAIEVRDEIEAITVDTKRRLKALIEEKARLEAKVSTNKANSERLFELFKANLRKALIESGVAEDRVDHYQVRFDTDLNILSVTDDGTNKEM